MLEGLSASPIYFLPTVCTRILIRNVEIDMKGKLETYDPYRGYSPKFRRERMIADGIIPPDAEEEPEPLEDSTPVEDDDLMCDGCDAPITIVDEFTETECGTFCTPCRKAHNGDCPECAADWQAAEADEDEAPEAVHTQLHANTDDKDEDEESIITAQVPALQPLVFHISAPVKDSQFALF